MHEKISEKISVITSYSLEKKLFLPRKIRWRGREYLIEKLGYHHRVREGKQLFHIFHVSNATLDFRLRFDTENLEWTMEEVSDGYAS